LGSDIFSIGQHHRDETLHGLVLGTHNPGLSVARQLNLPAAAGYLHPSASAAQNNARVDPKKQSNPYDNEDSYETNAASAALPHRILNPAAAPSRKRKPEPAPAGAIAVTIVTAAVFHIFAFSPALPSHRAASFLDRDQRTGFLRR